MNVDAIGLQEVRAVNVRVFATPALIEPGALHGATAIVIDTLRMTSVATVSIANGALGLLPIQDVEEARTIAKDTNALLGGERGALPIAGFDLSNSPLAYTRQRVSGRRIVMTTTNGTKAILSAATAEQVLLGCLMNAAAAAEIVLTANRLSIVCAGTGGAFSLEDALTAGAIIHRLNEKGIVLHCDDMAQASLTLYNSAAHDLHGTLAKTAHYQHLRHLGMEDDLHMCLTMDCMDAVPQMQPDGWFK